MQRPVANGDFQCSLKCETYFLWILLSLPYLLKASLQPFIEQMTCLLHYSIDSQAWSSLSSFNSPWFITELMLQQYNKKSSIHISITLMQFTILMVYKAIKCNIHGILITDVTQTWTSSNALGKAYCECGSECYLIYTSQHSSQILIFTSS